MGEGLTPGEPCGPHTASWRAGGPAPPGGVGAPQPPSVSPSVSVYVTAIYGRGFSSRAIPRIFPVGPKICIGSPRFWSQQVALMRWLGDVIDTGII